MSDFNTPQEAGPYTTLPEDSPTAAAAAVAAGHLPLLQTPGGGRYLSSDDVEAGEPRTTTSSSSWLSSCIPSPSSRQQPSLSRGNSSAGGGLDHTASPAGPPPRTTRLTSSGSGRLGSLSPTPEAAAAAADGSSGSHEQAQAAAGEGGEPHGGGGAASQPGEGTTATSPSKLHKWRRATGQLISIQRLAAQVAPGFLPGLDVRRYNYDGYLGALNAPSRISCVDYSAVSVEAHEDITNHTLQDFLRSYPRPHWSKVRWINVQGLSWDVIEVLARTFDLHPLSVEDIVHIPQRIKADFFQESLYVSLILLATTPPGEQAAGGVGSPRGVAAAAAAALQHLGPAARAAAGGSRLGFTRRHSSSDKAAPARPAAAAAAATAAGSSGEGAAAGAGSRLGLGGMNGLWGSRYSSTGEGPAALRHPSQPATQLNRLRSGLLSYDGTARCVAAVAPPAALAAAGGPGGLAAAGGPMAFQLPVELLVEQASFFLLRDGTLLTFFQGEGERVTAPLLERVKGYRTLLTDSEDASFLMNCLIDGVVDHAMPVVQMYFKRILELEAQVISQPRPKAALTKELHLLCNDLKALRRAMIPMQHLVHKLQSSGSGGGSNSHHSTMPSSLWHNLYSSSGHLNAPSRPPAGSWPASPRPTGAATAAAGQGGHDPEQRQQQQQPEAATATAAQHPHQQHHQQQQQQQADGGGPFLSLLTLTYLNDVMDHVSTMVEDMETLEDQAKELIELIFNTLSHSNNASMQILAVVSTLFLPITFIAGVYGMNYDTLPELHWSYGYLYFWCLCLAITMAFVVTLKRWGMFGG